MLDVIFSPCGRHGNPLPCFIETHISCRCLSPFRLVNGCFTWFVLFWSDFGKAGRGIMWVHLWL